MSKATLPCRRNLLEGGNLRTGISYRAGALAALLLIFLFPSMVWVTEADANEPKRIALVIGNDKYTNLPEHAQLKSAVFDARTIRDALKKLDFHVTYGENLSRVEFEDQLFDFSSLIGKDDIALFFYAGHGVSLGGGNYLLPSDIQQPTSSRRGEERRIKRRSIAEHDIIAEMKSAGARVAITVLDACRNNPLETGDDRSVLGQSRGLQLVEPKANGVFSIYSAGQGQTALDRLPDEKGQVNSVFTRVFAKAIVEPGLPLSAVVRQVRKRVHNLVLRYGRNQTPAFYDQVVGAPVVLSPKPRAVAVVPAENGGHAENDTSGSTTTLGRPQPSSAEREKRIWGLVKNSKDPEVLKNFLQEYPNGIYADVARYNISQLDQQDKAREETRKKREQEAKRRRKEQEDFWNGVKDSENPDDLLKYTRKFPDGIFADDAKRRIERLARAQVEKKQLEIEFWKSVKDSNNADLLRQYVKRYPDGIYASIAEIMIETLTSQKQKQDGEEERRVWESARQSGDVKRITSYLERYPNGRFADIAREMIRFFVEREYQARQQQERLKQEQQIQQQNQQAFANPVPPAPAPAPVYDDCGNSALSGLGPRQKAATQVRLYYRDIGNRNVDCALARWANPSYKLPGLIRNFGGAAVNSLRVVSRRGRRIRIVAGVKVRTRRGRWEYYNMRIDMINRSGNWLISKMRAR